MTFDNRARTLNTRRNVLPTLLKMVCASLPFDRLSAYLPFQTRIVAGFNFNHIQSLSGFDIETERRVIEEGDTLCGRKSCIRFLRYSHEENCPGCEAIARGLVAREIENA